MKNLLYEASAGTGKTYRLVEHMVAKLAESEPRELVALTFSRAAAGEIFARFVRRLAADCAESAAAAERLRKVIATQHLSLIGTLDSVLMRFAEMFPLELGLTGEVSVLEDYSRAGEAARVSLALLRKCDTETKRKFAGAFALAMNREASRSFLEVYADLVTKWHELFLDLGDFALPQGLPSAHREELVAAAEAVKEYAPEIAEAVRAFDGSFSKLATPLRNLLAVEDFRERAVIEFNINRKKRTFAGEEAAGLKRCVEAVYGFVIERKAEMLAGIRLLVGAFEDEYGRKVRASGRLTFSDVPRLVARLDASARLALEYRLDARIRHWALDEFQDTSHGQWNAISNLVEEAAQSPDGKSVLIVGDRKQAIYGWRSGDVAIFAGEKAKTNVYDILSLNESWRYLPSITEAVNRVFVDVVPRHYSGWECPTHVSHEKQRPGFYHQVAVAGGKMDDFVGPLANELLAIRPWERGKTSAILVRGNKFGELLGTELRARGVKAVWEGDSAVLDSPVLRAFVALVKLAEHPGDELAYNHICATPLKDALPDANPAELSRLLLADFTVKGLARAFEEIRERIPASAWDRFTETRFADMLRAAARFEEALEPGTRLAQFEAYLESERRRDLASSDSVKIMTIHRSKGLGFDYVLVPLYEHEGIDGASDNPIVGDGWVLPGPGERVALMTPALKDEYLKMRERETYESLCVYYVAMTRAKEALTVFLPPPPKSETKTTKFSALVREAELADEIGDREWYLKVADGKGTAPDTAAKGTQGEEAPPKPVRAKREKVSRRLPSLSFHKGQSAGTLFAGGARKSAATRGTEIHKEFEAVEFNDWILRPEGFTELWRERAFEIFADGVWVSGQFDRVVFCGDHAVIQDYKTGRHVDPEHYRGQMTAYRKALAILTGLPESSICCELLLTETKTVVPM